MTMKTSHIPLTSLLLPFPFSQKMQYSLFPTNESVTIDIKTTEKHYIEANIVGKLPAVHIIIFMLLLFIMVCWYRSDDKGYIYWCPLHKKTFFFNFKTTIVRCYQHQNNRKTLYKSNYC